MPREERARDPRSGHSAPERGVPPRRCAREPAPAWQTSAARPRDAAPADPLTRERPRRDAASGRTSFVPVRVPGQGGGA